HPIGSPERRQSSRDARLKIQKYVGTDSTTGQTKPLLTTNQKLKKANSSELTLPDGSGVETTGLSLSPAYEHKNFKVCPNSHSCKTSCLGKTSGGNFVYGGGKDLEAIKGPRLNHYNKTQAFIHEPKAFAIRLHDEIHAAKSVAALNGSHLGVRLNVLSDIHPKVYKSLMQAHPDVSFYDYTKNNVEPVAPNHHLTYSSTGATQPTETSGLDKHVENPHGNWTMMRKRLDQGHNVAMAFSHNKILPQHVHDQETGKTYKVISGDEHDFRPIDEKGVVVGLTRKAQNMSNKTASHESNGFFVHYDPKPKMQGGKIAKDEHGNPIATNTTVHIAPQKRKTILLDNDSKNVGE
ncbi:MAG TPA: hypothetical protein VFM18_00545, partial [Methanosarcina sp.]|nr:hypothetical protein [Methanosarcina sp.]